MTTQACERLSQDLLGGPYAALTPLQRAVIDAIAREGPTKRSPSSAETEDAASFWDRLADRVARVGGSWGFIFSFFGVLLAWVAINSPPARRLGLVFDAYPFIFLNLVLSMLAAIQAPVIMMSQNRSAAKDRAAAEHDYVVNLRAELEILRLHTRLDQIEAVQLATVLTQQTEILELLRFRQA